MDRCIQHHHGQVVGQVVAVLISAADGQTFAAEATALTDFCSTAVSDLGGVVHLYEGNLQKLLCELLGDLAFLDVFLIVRIQPLIHSAVGNGMSIALDLGHGRCKIEQLQCLPEALRRAACDLMAVVSHGKKFCFPLRICFLRRLLPGQCLISCNVFLCCLMADEHCFIEFSLHGKIRILLGQLGKPLLSSSDHAVKAFLHQALIVHHQMTDTTIVVQVRLENLLAYLRAFLHVLIHVLIGQILYGLTLPVSTQLDKLLSVLFVCKVMLVMFTLLKRLIQCLIKHPVDGKLRILRGCFCRCTDLTEDQLLVIDPKRCIQQDLLKCFRTFDLGRCSLIFLISLCHVAETLHVNQVLPIQECFSQMVDTGIRGPVLVANLISDTVVFVIRIYAACCGVYFAHRSLSF